VVDIGVASAPRTNSRWVTGSMFRMKYLAFLKVVCGNRSITVLQTSAPSGGNPRLQMGTAQQPDTNVMPGAFPGEDTAPIQELP
jgi:hypothetical protein